MLKIILIAIAVIVVVFVIVAAMQPSDFTVRRTAKISAPASVLFENTNDLHKWNEWSPWAKADPTSKIVYDGPPSGVGSSFSWSGGKTGEGTMTNIETVPEKLLRFRLDFRKPFAATNTAPFKFTPEGDQTEVEWSMSGRNNFFFKAFGLFMNCDKMIGGDFEKGLASLKIIAEAKP